MMVEWCAYCRLYKGVHRKDCPLHPDNRYTDELIEPDETKDSNPPRKVKK